MICFTFQKLLNLLFVLMLYFVGLNAQADEITFYHYDGMGNPIAATDMQGNVVWKERYSPSGEPLLNQPAKEGHNIGYKGHVYDKELGLVYMAHRYYDPKVGRFLSNDPVGFTPSNVQSFSRYAYANNNPYKYWDPDGLYADLIVESVSIGLGLKSFWDNYYQGNYGAAAVDAFGVAADTALAAVPFLPGGVGLGIQSVRKGSGYLQNVHDRAGGYVDLTSSSRRTHILDGDATGGGHRYGNGIPGKSEFPSSWSDDRIIHEISDVATDPTSISRAGYRGRTITEGTRGGVDIRVVQERNGNIITGFPTNTPRNP